MKQSEKSYYLTDHYMFCPWTYPDRRKVLVVTPVAVPCDGTEELKSLAELRKRYQRFNIGWPLFVGLPFRDDSGDPTMEILDFDGTVRQVQNPAGSCFPRRSFSIDPDKLIRAFEKEVNLRFMARRHEMRSALRTQLHFREVEDKKKK